jgi:hypothetical protein
MATIDSKNLIVAMKAFSRANALPLDASELHESLEAAQVYAASGKAYAGQTIRAKLEDGKYHEYILQPSDEGYTLEEVGAITESDLKHFVQVVDALPTSGVAEVIYIDTTAKTGYIWFNGEWKPIFKDVDSALEDLEGKIDDLGGTKAPIDNPTFTGTVTLAADPSEDLQAVTKQYVDRLIDNLVSPAPAVVDAENALPVSVKAGQTWRVAVDGTYAGAQCEAGDLIIALKDAESATDADFMVVQANIDGAVTSKAEAATVGNIVVFDSITGKVIADSEVAIASLKDAIEKSHEHTNLETLETYDKTQSELLAAAKADAKDLVDTLAETVDGKADKATTLEGYGIGDAYTKTAVDTTVEELKSAIDAKISTTAAEDKIAEAVSASKTEITGEYKEFVADRLGEEITDAVTVAEYVASKVANSGLTEASSEAIEAAKKEAIATAKAYADELHQVIILE